MKNKYKCLSKNKFSIKGYIIIPLRKSDIFKIKKWRNEQIDILRNREYITNAEQLNYYNNIIYPAFQENKPTQILFSYFHKTNLIGYGGLVHISWSDKRAEVSFLIDTKRKNNLNIYKKDFSSFLELLKKVSYKDLYLNRLYTETFQHRTEHIKILVNNKFYKEGIMKQHVLIDGIFTDSIIHGNLCEYEKY